MPVVVNKPFFALLVVVVNASAVLAGSLLPIYVPQMISIPLVTFIDALSNGLIIYFGTEEQTAPATQTIAGGA